MKNSIIVFCVIFCCFVALANAAELDELVQAEEVRNEQVVSGDLLPPDAMPGTTELTAPSETRPLPRSKVEPEQVGVIKTDQGAEVEQSIVVQAEPIPRRRKRRSRERRPLLRYSYDISVAADDNIRLAQNDLDIRSDLLTSATIKAKGGMALDKFSNWSYGARVTYNSFDTFDTLNNIDFDINTRFSFSFTSGFSAPIYSVGVKLGGSEFDTVMRDSTYISLSADLNKQLTTTINMSTGWRYKQQESKSKVFDISENRIFVNFDTNFSKKDLVYITLSYIAGDVVSSATPSVGIINAAEAVEADDAFGGIAFNQFAYRLEANTFVFTVGYNRPLTRGLSVDFSAQFVDTQSTEDSAIGYERSILTASLLGRF